MHSSGLGDMHSHGTAVASSLDDDVSKKDRDTHTHGSDTEHLHNRRHDAQEERRSSPHYHPGEGSRIEKLHVDEKRVDPWKISPFTVTILIVMSLGLAFVVPGVVMRGEKVPAPSPYIGVNLCLTEKGNYRFTDIPCDPRAALADDAKDSSLSIPLHSKLLVADVIYIPVVYLPDANGRFLFDTHCLFLLFCVYRMLFLNGQYV